MAVAPPGGRGPALGAVPGGGFLTQAWFDVEQFRQLRHRRAVVRRAEGTALVLGSTQSSSVVDEDPDVQVLRRRAGGGAVLVVPGDTVWVDVWLPRADPLWVDDVVRAAELVGEWWAYGLSRLVARRLEVHRGGSLPRAWSDLVCFAGVGPGEVLAGGRKLVGLAQWRSREGTLVQGCVYRRWRPSDLPRLLRFEPGDALDQVAVGLDELCGGEPPGIEAVVAAVLDALPGDWDVAGRLP